MGGGVESGVSLSLSIYSKVEMDIGDARLGRKRRRSWRASRDINHDIEHETRQHIYKKHILFHGKRE